MTPLPGDPPQTVPPAPFRRTARIGGAWNKPGEDATIAVRHPATGARVGRVGQPGADGRFAKEARRVCGGDVPGPLIGAASTPAARPRTRDHGRAWRVGGAIDRGMAGVAAGPIPAVEGPSGGVGMAGAGREGPRCGIEEDRA